MKHFASSSFWKNYERLPGNIQELADQCYKRLKANLQMCSFLGIKPVFAARMLPKSWINEVVDSGGFALIMKYQLYPLAHRELARRVRSELGLPVDTPKALAEGTMDRFVRWHEKNL